MTIARNGVSAGNMRHSRSQIGSSYGESTITRLRTAADYLTVGRTSSALECCSALAQQIILSSLAAHSFLIIILCTFP